MQQLLRGEDPSARVVLLAGFYSVGLAQLYEQFFQVEVISCDLRYPEACGGMHYRGDVRDILHARRWAILVAAPPCKNLAWASFDRFPEKQANGTQWRGLAFALLLWSAPADVVILEQGRSELSRFLGPPSQIFHPYHLRFGDEEQKTTFLWIRGSYLRIEYNGASEGNWQRSHDLRIHDLDRREIERARWSFALNYAIASTFDLRRIPVSIPERDLNFASLLADAAALWTALNRPLPAGALDCMARAPGGDEAAVIATKNGVPRLVPQWLKEQRAAATAGMRAPPPAAPNPRAQRGSASASKSGSTAAGAPATMDVGSVDELITTARSRVDAGHSITLSEPPHTPATPELESETAIDQPPAKAARKAPAATRSMEPSGCIGDSGRLGSASALRAASAPNDSPHKQRAPHPEPRAQRKASASKPVCDVAAAPQLHAVRLHSFLVSATPSSNRAQTSELPAPLHRAPAPHAQPYKVVRPTSPREVGRPRASVAVGVSASEACASGNADAASIERGSPMRMPPSGMSTSGNGNGVPHNPGSRADGPNLRVAELDDTPRPAAESDPLADELLPDLVIVVPVCRRSSAIDAPLLALVPNTSNSDVLAASERATSREQAKTIAVAGIAAAAPGFDPALTLVMRWHGAHLVVVLSSHCPGDTSIADTPAQLGNAGSSSQLCWCSQRVISSLPQASLLTDCLVRIQQLREPSAAQLSGAQTGASGECFARANIVHDAVEADAEARRQRASASVLDLQQALYEAAENSSSQGEGDFLRQWAVACKPLDAASLPEGWQKACFEFSDATITDTPFVRRCVINATRPGEHAAEQPPLPDGTSITGKQSILKPWAIRKISKKLRKIQEWHDARARGKEARRPSPLALGKDAFVGDMWRWVWDLRGDVPILAEQQGRAHEGQYATNAEALIHPSRSYDESRPRPPDRHLPIAALAVRRRGRRRGSGSGVRRAQAARLVRDVRLHPFCAVALRPSRSSATRRRRPAERHRR